MRRGSLLGLALCLLAIAFAPFAPYEAIRAKSASPEQSTYLWPGSRSATIRQLLAQVSAERLVGHICKLQDDDGGLYCNPLGSRYVFNEAGQAEAQAYIRRALEEAGLQVTFDPFQAEGRTLYNLVATLPAAVSDAGVYILCAHYDSTSPLASAMGPAPGADDNASGVAVLLEIARLLSGQRLAHETRFIAFTGEEPGTWGSNHYAAQAAARGEAIRGVINLDMVGYDGNGDRLIELHAGRVPASIALAETFARVLGEYGIALVPVCHTWNAIDLSDHGPFWRFGYPAILAIEGYNARDITPHYHQITDTVDRLTLPYLLEYAKGTLAAMAELAGLMPVVRTEIVLQPGWNLISLPVAPLWRDPERLLSERATLAYAYKAQDASNPWRAYSPTAPEYANDLQAVTVGEGIWVKAEEATTLEFSGTVPSELAIPLQTGWNLIGHLGMAARPISETLASIAGLYTVIYGYVNDGRGGYWREFRPGDTATSTLTQTVPGAGYWIEITQPCTLTIAGE